MILQAFLRQAAMKSFVRRCVISSAKTVFCSSWFLWKAVYNNYYYAMQRCGCRRAHEHAHSFQEPTCCIETILPEHTSKQNLSLSHVCICIAHHRSCRCRQAIHRNVPLPSTLHILTRRSTEGTQKGERPPQTGPRHTRVVEQVAAEAFGRLGEGKSDEVGRIIGQIAEKHAVAVSDARAMCSFPATRSTGPGSARKFERGRPVCVCVFEGKKKTQ